MAYQPTDEFCAKHGLISSHEPHLGGYFWFDKEQNATKCIGYVDASNADVDKIGKIHISLRDEGVLEPDTVFFGWVDDEHELETVLRQVNFFNQPN